MCTRVGRIAGVMSIVVAFVVMLSSGAIVRGQVADPAAPLGGEFRAGEFRTGGYPETYQNTFYPGTELRALPGAKAQSMVAAAVARRAQKTLDNAIMDIRRSFLRSPELAAALGREQAAFDELTAARRRAMAGLANDSNYLAALELKGRLAEQIEDAKESKETPLQERLARASLKLSYATTVTAMEASAMAADSRVTEARQKLVAAGKEVSALYQQLDESIRTSPTVLAARKQLDDARVAAIGADALYVEARNVATVAMDYAYFLYGQPYGYAYNTAWNSGYGYPMRLGYPIGYPIGYPHSWSSVHGPRR